MKLKLYQSIVLTTAFLTNANPVAFAQTSVQPTSKTPEFSQASQCPVVGSKSTEKAHGSATIISCPSKSGDNKQLFACHTFSGTEICNTIKLK